jgi:hypothetical protein
MASRRILRRKPLPLPPIQDQKTPRKPHPSSCIVLSKRILRVAQIYPLLLVFENPKLRLLALFEVIPLSPCGKRNPLSQNTPPCGCFRLFGTQIWKLKADFTVVGVSVGSLLSCSAGLRSKATKQARNK